MNWNEFTLFLATLPESDAWDQSDYVRYCDAVRQLSEEDQMRHHGVNYTWTPENSGLWTRSTCPQRDYYVISDWGLSGQIRYEIYRSDDPKPFVAFVSAMKNGFYTWVVGHAITGDDYFVSSIHPEGVTVVNLRTGVIRHHIPPGAGKTPSPWLWYTIMALDSTHLLVHGGVVGSPDRTYEIFDFSAPDELSFTEGLVRIETDPHIRMTAENWTFYLGGEIREVKKGRLHPERAIFEEEYLDWKEKHFTKPKKLAEIRYDHAKKMGRQDTVALLGDYFRTWSELEEENDRVPLSGEDADEDWIETYKEKNTYRVVAGRLVCIHREIHPRWERYQREKRGQEIAEQQDFENFLARDPIAQFFMRERGETQFRREEMSVEDQVHLYPNRFWIHVGQLGDVKYMDMDGYIWVKDASVARDIERLQAYLNGESEDE